MHHMMRPKQRKGGAHCLFRMMCSAPPYLYHVIEYGSFGKVYGQKGYEFGAVVNFTKKNGFGVIGQEIKWRMVYTKRLPLWVSERNLSQ